MNYEEKIKELENIAEKLEHDLPLGDAIKEYSKGTEIIKECLENLDNEKGTITKIKQELDKFIEQKMN